MNQATEQNGPPKYAPIPRACYITGLGRSTIYKLAGNGTLRLIKAGGRTLVDIDAALEYMGNRGLKAALRGAGMVG